MEKCINPKCENLANGSRNMCKACYQRFTRKGTYERDRILNTTECKYCGVKKSPDGVWRKGYCSNCYHRWKKHGTPEYVYEEQIRGTEFCIDCGTNDPGGKGNWNKQRCIKCYGNYRRRLENKPQRMVGIRICLKCNKEREENEPFKRGLCLKCYAKEPDQIETKRRYNRLEHRKKYRREYVLNIYQNNFSYRLHNKIGCRIRKLFKKNQLSKDIKTEMLLGCTIEELKTQFEDLLLDDMNWNNYGYLWQIEHIIPQALFDLKDELQKYICWNYRNLRPEYSDINNQKSDILLDDTRARSFKGDILEFCEKNYPEIYYSGLDNYNKNTSQV